MSKKELVDYYRWFLDQIPVRIAILEKAVRCTPGFEHWRADYVPESLDTLGDWFARQVQTRERTAAEIEDISADIPHLVEFMPSLRWVLTNRTYSVAIDIAMYLSQVLLRNNPSLKWQQTIKGSKRWIDYGQPVLAGFGWGVFNPVGIMVTLANALADGTWESTELRQIYEKKHTDVLQEDGK